MIARTHAQVFMHDRLLAVVPLFCEEGDHIEIRDRIRHVRDALWNVYAMAHACVQEFLLSFAGFGHYHGTTFGEKIVFIKLRMIVIAADFALVDELEVKLHDGFAGVKGKYAAAPISDRVEVARGVYFFDLHMRFTLASS